LQMALPLLVNFVDTNNSYSRSQLGLINILYKNIKRKNRHIMISLYIHSLYRLNCRYHMSRDQK
jgi:hypothetical protein